MCPEQIKSLSSMYWKPTRRCSSFTLINSREPQHSIWFLNLFIFNRRAPRLLTSPWGGWSLMIKIPCPQPSLHPPTNSFLQHTNCAPDKNSDRTNVSTTTVLICTLYYNFLRGQYHLFSNVLYYSQYIFEVLFQDKTYVKIFLNTFTVIWLCC